MNVVVTAPARAPACEGPAPDDDESFRTLPEGPTVPAEAHDQAEVVAPAVEAGLPSEVAEPPAAPTVVAGVVEPGRLEAVELARELFNNDAAMVLDRKWRDVIGKAEGSAGRVLASLRKMAGKPIRDFIGYLLTTIGNEPAAPLTVSAAPPVEPEMAEVARIIGELRRNCVTFWVKDGDVHFNIPTLSAERQMKEHWPRLWALKPFIVRFLTEQGQVFPKAPVPLRVFAPETSGALVESSEPAAAVEPASATSLEPQPRRDRFRGLGERPPAELAATDPILASAFRTEPPAGPPPAESPPAPEGP